MIIVIKKLVLNNVLLSTSTNHTTSFSCEKNFTILYHEYFGRNNRTVKIREQAECSVQSGLYLYCPNSTKI